MAWQYLVEYMSIADRWTAKAQQAEIERFNTSLNQRGQEAWEMIAYESVPMYGTFSDKLKGYAYLIFWKRPSQTDSTPQPTSRGVD